MLKIDEVYLGDCLDVMRSIDDARIDMILCDLPYGITRNKWDSIIPLETLWGAYERVVKYNTAIVLTAAQPFTSILIMSNRRLFKYCWVWDKINRFSGHLNSKRQPLRIYEDVCVFYDAQCIYNPIMTAGVPYKCIAVHHGRNSSNYGVQRDKTTTVNNGQYYPHNIIRIAGDERGSVGRIHPTQKPVALFEYLIKTYTNEGDLVLDNACGSGTTGVACKHLNRRFILIDNDPKYVEITRQRLQNE